MDLHLADLLTVGGASAVVTLVMSILLRALALPSASVDRFGPLLAVGMAFVLVIPTAIVLGAPIGEAVLTALLAGCASQGIQQTLKGATAVTKDKLGIYQ